jgi:hypothetical protein
MPYPLFAIPHPAPGVAQGTICFPPGVFSFVVHFGLAYEVIILKTIKAVWSLHFFKIIGNQTYSKNRNYHLLPFLTAVKNGNNGKIKKDPEPFIRCERI